MISLEEYRALDGLGKADEIAKLYGRMGIYMKREGDSVRVKQMDGYTGVVLTREELQDRAEKTYKDTGVKLKYKVETFTLDQERITLDWIQEQIKRLGVKNQDIANQLGLTASTISGVLNGSRALSNQMKTLFFYYLMFLQNGKSSREEHTRLNKTISTLYEEIEELRGEDIEPD